MAKSGIGVQTKIMANSGNGVQNRTIITLGVQLNSDKK
jgi:hypothetical protein